MPKFLEITVLETNTKMLINLSDIKLVEEREDGTAKITIDLSTHKKGWYDLSVYTEEPYKSIAAILKSL